MDNLLPEHIEGKTIEKVVIKGIEVQITFTDGGTAFFRLGSLGLNGEKMICDYYFPSSDDDEDDLT